MYFLSLFTVLIIPHFWLFVKRFLKKFSKIFFVQFAQRTNVRFGLGAPAAGEGHRVVHIAQRRTDVLLKERTEASIIGFWDKATL